VQVTGDRTARSLGVLQEMTRRQLRVPDDIAIVGNDDIDFAAAAAVPLSSVRQTRRELGRAAADLLIEETSEHRRHGHSHRLLVFEPDLVVRASSDHMRPSRHREITHARVVANVIRRLMIRTRTGC
jgi:LacI family transcriptional regulator